MVSAEPRQVIWFGFKKMRHKSRSSKLTVPPREGVGHIERIGRKGGRDMIRAGPAAGGGGGKDPPQGGRTPQGGAYHHLDWLVFVATTAGGREPAGGRAAGRRVPYVRKNRCFFRILREIRVRSTKSNQSIINQLTREKR